MRAASAALLAGILAVSVITPYASFRYVRFRSRRNEIFCRMCYGEECVSLEQARCEYYAAVDGIRDELDEDGDATEVDEMIYNMVEEASNSWAVQDCIPLISKYTDCTKENICTGCENCICNASGKWICKEEQRCWPEADLVVDHHVLETVIGRLGQYGISTRRKRSFSNDTGKQGVVPSLSDIAEWMYGVRPNVVLTAIDVTPIVVNFSEHVKKTDSPTTSSRTSSSTEPNYLDFDEVLKNIVIDDRIYKRRKPNLNNGTGNDYTRYMDLNEIKIVKNNESQQFLDVLNAIEEEQDGAATDSTNNTYDATFVVDLLGNDNEHNIDTKNNVTDRIGLNSLMNREMNNTIDKDDYNFGFELNAANIMKRDVSLVMESNYTTEITSIVSETITEPGNDLNNNVLIPLNSIIGDKQNELNDLVHIKENLMRYMEIYNNTELTNAMDRSLINGSNTYFSIYKLDLSPQIQGNFKRTNLNILDKLLLKLKRDIYEIMSDITRIQKLSQTKELPKNLKMLMRCMKYYIHKQRVSNKLRTTEKANNFKRNLFRGNTNTNVVKQHFVNIFEVLDDDKQQFNAVTHLSQGAKKIIKRVINQYYTDEYTPFGLKIYNSDYNLTKDLKLIGRSWPQLTINIENSSPSEKLYAMKLLHFALCTDISKMTDAMSLIDFAHSRRMILIDTPGDELMDKINDGLNSIKDKIHMLIKYYDKTARAGVSTETYKHKAKKQSFMKKLRNLLRSSKKETVEMDKKNVPKPEIVRTIAQKRLDELARNTVSQHEETMLKWQNNLNLLRKKRAPVSLKEIGNKIKNIIPKYLRSKVNPALHKHKTTKKNKGRAKKSKKNNHFSATTMRAKSRPQFIKHSMKSH